MFYPKINGPFKRWASGASKGKLIFGDWACPEFEYLKDNQWHFTEKIDGTNIIVKMSRIDDVLFVTFFGRTANAIIPKPLVAKLKELFPFGMATNDLTDRTSKIVEWMIYNDLENVCLYGEGIGKKIQSGLYGEEFNFVLFDVKIGDFWLTHENVVDVAKNLDLDYVQSFGTGDLYDAIVLVQSDNFESLHQPGGKCEGVIARPTCQLFNRKNERVTTKIKVRDFT